MDPASRVRIAPSCVGGGPCGTVCGKGGCRPGGGMMVSPGWGQDVWRVVTVFLALRWRGEGRVLRWAVDWFWVVVVRSGVCYAPGVILERSRSRVLRASPLCSGDR